MPRAISIIPSPENRLRGSSRYADMNKKYEKMDHPATSQMNYTEEEIEFMMAQQAWCDRTGRKFPTCSEILGIAKSIGYAKVLPVQGPHDC